MSAYRIALRTYEDAGGKGKGPTDKSLDDIVVRGVSMFRMEDMGDYFWMCCYLNGTNDRIDFQVRRGRKGEPKIVVQAYNFPDVPYEDKEHTA